jgi:hypothetical protein
MDMKSIWRYRDIIDLEYFLSLDNGASPEKLPDLHKRDRRIFQGRFNEKSGEQNKTSRRFLLRQWLEGRREEERSGGNTLLPGQLAEEVFSRVCFLFFALGILTGLGSGYSFFTYTGTAPLNVFHYLAIFVFLQLILLLILGCVFIVRTGKFFPTPSLLSSLVADLLIKIFQRSANRLLSQLSADKRNGFSAALGVIKTKSSYSPLLYWPVFMIMQFSAIGFNVGLLSTTLYKVAVTDIAFGWQSTIRFSSEAIYQLVRFLALPWSWLLGSHLAHPSLLEIEGSRIILKDGIAHLATGDLISWWPFLCFALLTYGLLPRLFLLLVAANSKKRILRKLHFGQAIFSRILLRMQTPLVLTQAKAEGQKEFEATSSESSEERISVISSMIHVLIPADIFDRCPDAELYRILAPKKNLLINKTKTGDDYASDRKILADLAAHAPGGSGVLILVEAWMPPITDFVVFLKDLRKALPQTAPIRVGLLGRANTETIFTPAKPGDMKIWKQKFDSLGDPYLSLENLI